MKKPVPKLRIFIVSIQAGWRMFKHCYNNMKVTPINCGDKFEIKYVLIIEFVGSEK